MVVGIPTPTPTPNLPLNPNSPTGPCYDPSQEQERPPVRPPFTGGQCPDSQYAVYGTAFYQLSTGSPIQVCSFAFNSGNRVLGPIRSVDIGPNLLRLRANTNTYGGITAPSNLFQYLLGPQNIIIDAGPYPDNCGNPPDEEPGLRRRPLPLPETSNPPTGEPDRPPRPPVFDLIPPIPDIDLLPLPPGGNINLPDFQFPPTPPFLNPPLPDFDFDVDIPRPPSITPTPPIWNTPIPTLPPPGIEPTSPNPEPLPPTTDDNVIFPAPVAPPTDCEHLRECLQLQMPEQTSTMYYLVNITSFPTTPDQIFGGPGGRTIYPKAGYVARSLDGDIIAPVIPIRYSSQLIEAQEDEIVIPLPNVGYTFSITPI